MDMNKAILLGMCLGVTYMVARAKPQNLPRVGKIATTALLRG